MADAISVLEKAWAIAYKEIGKEGAEVATIDMITGRHPARWAAWDVRASLDGLPRLDPCLCLSFCSCVLVRSMISS